MNPAVIHDPKPGNEIETPKWVYRVVERVGDWVIFEAIPKRWWQQWVYRYFVRGGPHPPLAVQYDEWKRVLRSCSVLGKTAPW